MASLTGVARIARTDRPRKLQQNPDTCGNCAAMNFILIFTLQCVFPIFNNGADDYTGLSIVNPDNVAHDFSISAIAGSGETTRTAILTIQGNGQRVLLLSDLFGATPTSGSLQIESVLPTCTVYLTSGNSVSFAGTDAANVGST